MKDLAQAKKELLGAMIATIDTSVPEGLALAMALSMTGPDRNWPQAAVRRGPYLAVDNTKEQVSG